MAFIKNGTPGFFEKNNTKRITTQAQITHSINERSKINVKNSYSRFDRGIDIPTHRFKGLQQSTFSEFTYHNNGQRMDWIVGANFLTDDFKEDPLTDSVLRNYQYNTLGVFVQNTYTASSTFSVFSSACCPVLVGTIFKLWITAGRDYLQVADHIGYLAVCDSHHTERIRYLRLCGSPSWVF